ncbi:hypothetical protein [Nocardioides conyzicola]|uniref:Uncharacterized protein n=1 Tax=Nocardioides conyzicola TaxID=1651781 RepID=A0ABP8XEG7_9ACTN
MTKPEPSTALTAIPDMEMVARAWHEVWDEPLGTVPFGSNGCHCRNYAPYAKGVLELFYGDPIAEPDGLGAVVVNPLTGGVWVRAAHPSLPWHDPASASPQEWSDPTREDHYVWADLPRPLVVQSIGWKPPTTRPTAPAPPVQPPEPTGIGAVVVDATGAAWVRVHDGREPWLQVDAAGTGLAENWEGSFYAVSWSDLTQPIQIRSHGWHRSVNAS